MSKIICSIINCSGCGACLASCPKHCIYLKGNKQGHLFPEIDESQCINCGQCVKTCPVNNKPTFNFPKQCYAAWAKNEKTRTSCSSGGISTVLSEYIINKGGIVYGCASLKNLEFKHIRVDNIKDLELLKGSKYVYSNCEDVYRQIKQDLVDNKEVLFIGTPCQNAGILNYIGHNENLYTVNLICHGVPSQQMLKDHIKDKAKITNISFRAGNNYVLKYDSYSSTNSLIPNTYLTLFLKGINYRSSCYSCIYAQEKRIGDITLGDFWGLGKKTPFKENVENGCNVFIVNTDKGLQLLNCCKENINLYQRQYEEAVSGNKQLKSPVHRGIYNKLFNKFYTFLSFNKAAIFATLPMFLLETVKLLTKKYVPACFYKQILKFYKRINN